MPIPILSLPGKDFQYALNCMDIGDLIALSLCSKRAKKLVKDSNRKIRSIHVNVLENRIRLLIMEWKLEESIYLNLSDFGINKDRGKIWRKQEYTQTDWIAHFLYIFNESMIHVLKIENTSLSYLDTVKQIIPKCRILYICENCSVDLTKMAFLKLSPIAVEKVEVQKNVFDIDNDISKFLSLNLKSVLLHGWNNPLKLNSDDLSMSNIADLTIHKTIITERELNRFLKMWMKGNHRFYRPELIKLLLNDGLELNRKEVLKGIKYQVSKDDECVFLLNRKDGKLLMGIMKETFITLLF